MCAEWWCGSEGLGVSVLLRECPAPPHPACTRQRGGWARPALLESGSPPFSRLLATPRPRSGPSCPIAAHPVLVREVFLGAEGPWGRAGHLEWLSSPLQGPPKSCCSWWGVSGRHVQPALLSPPSRLHPRVILLDENKTHS